MKLNLKSFFHSACVSLGIIVCVCAGMYHSSCRITPEGIVLVGGEESSPKITDFHVDGKDIEVCFSKEVFVEDMCAAEDNGEMSSIENFLTCENKIPVEHIPSEDCCTVKFRINGETEIGKSYGLYSCVKDKRGNSLSFSVPFLGENTNFPVTVISEVSDSYSKKDFMYEYVELYTVTAGNLFGLELVSASDGKRFALPAVDVGKGEYIVVHLRKPDDEKAVSELSGNLNESKAPGSVRGARDIWIENQESVLNSSAEILILNNRAKSKFEDCVFYCKRSYAKENAAWKTDALAAASKQCAESGLWHGGISPADAVFSEKRDATSFISRKNIPVTASPPNHQNSNSAWVGTPKSKSTPGKPNTW